MDLIDFVHPHKVIHVENKAGKLENALARLNATGMVKLSQNRLKSNPILRRLVIWVRRNFYPAYVDHIAIHFHNRKVKIWHRLINLNEYVKENGLPIIHVAEAEFVETPAPKAYPACDQGCLESPHNGYDFPSIYVTTISNGMIYGGTNLVLSNNEVICHDLFDCQRDYTSEELHRHSRIDPWKGRIRILLKDELPEFLPAAAVFVDACASNYAHWLTEVLPRIAAFCSEEQFKDVPIVINEGLHKNIMESLYLMLEDEREIITLAVGRGIQVGMLYLTSVAGYVPFERRSNKFDGHSHGKFSPRAFQIIRYRVAEFTKNLPSQEWPEKIYLRRNSGSRNVVNSAELEELLSAQGYVIFEPEKLSFLQQVMLFRNAKEIISPTGAALSNAIFSQEGARIGVMMGKHVNMIYRYWLNMLTPLKINVFYILGETIGKQRNSIHADFFIDSKNIDLLIESWQQR